MTFFVLGDEDVILGFNFIGINGIIINNQDEAKLHFNKAINSEYGNMGVILITEKVSTFIEKEVIDWQLAGQYPLLVEIPDLDGHLEGKKSMLESIREAIGLPI